jgi:hypothetical protein
MAHYLLRLPKVDVADQYKMVEADSAKQAVEGLNLEEGSVDVWTLRSNTARVFEVVTETTRTIKQT